MDHLVLDILDDLSAQDKKLLFDLRALAIVDVELRRDLDQELARQADHQNRVVRNHDAIDRRASLNERIYDHNELAQMSLAPPTEVREAEDV